LQAGVDDFHRRAQCCGGLSDAIMDIACGIGRQEIRCDHDFPCPGRFRPTSGYKECVR
jgi:hypothetical protein